MNIKVKSVVRKKEVGHQNGGRKENGQAENSSGSFIRYYRKLIVFVGIINIFGKVIFEVI